MKAMKIQASQHFIQEREDRMLFIAMNIGWGTEVLKVLSNGRWECVTDTGVLLVKSQEEDFLITAYLPNIDKVFALYRTCGQAVPVSIRKAIKRNQKMMGEKK